MRSAQNMSGYFERPEADAEIFRGGWLHTGDVGYLDGGGFLHILSRKTDMIISAGENIYCAEVERVLTQHPHVMEAATFGVPDARLGEKLVAVVVARAGSRTGRGAAAKTSAPGGWHPTRFRANGASTPARSSAPPPAR